MKKEYQRERDGDSLRVSNHNILHLVNNGCPSIDLITYAFEYKIKSKDLVKKLDKLVESGYLTKMDKRWQITPLGREKYKKTIKANWKKILKDYNNVLSEPPFDVERKKKDKK